MKRLLGKQKIKLRAAREAEPVAFERESIAQVLAFDRKQARRGGKRAWRTFKRRKKPKPRLSAYRYWVRINGLATRVELRFVDLRLYGAVVRILYAEAQRSAISRVLDLVAEKYGAPTDQAVEPDGSRTRLDFDAGDGRLTVFTETASKKRRGIVRMAYLANNVGSSVERYLEGIRGRLIQVQRVLGDRREAAREKKVQAAKRVLLRHL